MPLLSVFLLQPSAAPAKADLFGQTPAQVVAGGRQAWAKRFQAKMGSGGPLLGLEEERWWKSREAVNNDAIRKLPAGKRTAIAKVRKTMDAFHVAAIRVGEGITGGGTMWNPMYAAAGSAVEEGISRLLKGGPLPKANTLPIQMKRLDAMIASARKAAESEGRREEFDEGMKRANSSYASLKKLQAALQTDCEAFRKGSGPLGSWHAAFSLDWVLDAIEQGDAAWAARRW